MKNLFLAYENESFESSKIGADISPIEDHEYRAALQYLISWGQHDLNMGLISKFKIFDQDGNVVFVSEDKTISSDEVSA